MACTALVGLQVQARAADIMVSDAAELSSAISNASSGDRIILENDIALGTTLLPPVLTNVSIDGQGHTIDAQGNNRIFFLDSKDAVPAVSIENVTLKGGAAKGGNGGNGNGANYDGGGAGGGGGMGAGGAIFVNNGSLTIANVDFTDNSATGGNGGVRVPGGGTSGGGGGGGLGGGGGGGGQSSGGGGGGYSGGGGAPVALYGSPASVGGTGPGGDGGSNGAGQGGGINGGAGPNGGGGGLPTGAGGDPNGNGTEGGGGGGASDYGHAGNGGDFGGGGGDTTSFGVAGSGGFGGGGGGMGAWSNGGNGGFGGGAGGGFGYMRGPGTPGVGGGYAYQSGGGGAGFGGAVFVRSGASITIADGSFEGGSATGGGGYTPGAGAGGDLFLMSGTVTTFNPTGTLTINGTIADDSQSSLPLGQSYVAGCVVGPGCGAAIAITGGTVVLNGANTFAGGMSVQSRVRLGNSSAAGTGAITSLGATIDYADGISVANPIELDADGTKLNVDTGSAEQSGAISESGGSFSLEKTGNGALTLSGANTYSGGTLVSAGTIIVGADTVGSPGAIVSSALGTGGVTLDGATLQAGGSYTVANDIAVTTKGASIDNDGNVFTLTGTISDGATRGGLLTLLGSGTTELAGANTYSGGSLISAGTILVGVDTVGSHGAIVSSALGTGDVTLDGATLQAGGSYTVANDIAVTTKGASIDNDGNVFTLTGTISDGTTGGGTLTFLGSGTTELAGANTYSGGSLISAGTVTVGVDTVGGRGAIVSSALGTGNVTLDGATLQAGGSYTVANDIAMTANGAAVDNNGNVFTLSGTITDGTTGGGTLTFLGSGTTELAGANSYTGSTSVSAGTLKLSGDGTLGATSNKLLVSGGTLDFGGTTQTQDGGVSLTGGSIRNGTLRSGGIFDLQNGTVSAALTGTGSLEKSTTDTVTLGGKNTYSGATTISAGTLAAGVASAFSASSAVSIDSGAALDLGGNDQEIGSLTGQGTVTNSGTTAAVLTTGGDGSSTDFEGGIQDGSDATTGLTKTGGGMFTLKSSQSYSGPTRIEGGTLALADAGGIARSKLTITDGSFDISRTVSSSSTIVDLAGSPDGAVYLGDKRLIIGNAGSELAGAIVDEDLGGEIEIAAGTLTLSGTNTYTGATYIDSGATLAIKGGGSIASSAMISFGKGGGTFDISQTDTGASVTDINDIAGNSIIALGAKTLTVTSGSIFAGIIQDSGLGNGTGGSLVVAGGAFLELRGVNSFTGSTTIQDGGKLQLSDSGSLAASSGVVADGVLDISASTAATGVSVKSLSGGGAVYLGDIDLYITNANGAFNGSISDCGADGTSCASTQSGGRLTLEGGSLTLNGVNTYTGETTVSSGKLIVGDDSHAGASLASAVTVNNGGVIGGIGVIGALTVNQGGAVAPGNSIGTLSVNGDVTLAAGSIFSVEIAGNGSSDRISAGGTATLGGGQVEVKALDSRTSYATGQTYTILTATDGIDGGFDPVVLSKSAFLSAQLSQDTNSVDLTIARTKDASFASVADSPNGKSTAGALDMLQQSGPSLALYNKLLSLSADEARTAFDQLSGEIHGSTASGLIGDSQKLRDAIDNRVNAAFEGASSASLPVMAYGDDTSLTTAAIPAERFAAWGSAFGSWGSTDGDGNTAKVSHSTGGFVTGADGFVTDDWLLGMLAGYSHSSFNSDRGDSSASSDNYHLGVYGGAQWGALALRTGLAYTWSKIDSGRSVAFPDFADSLSGSYRAGTTQVFGEFGYTIKAGSVALEPFANLAYVDLDTNGFSEHGGAAALTVEGGSNDVTFSTLGLRASSDFDLGGLKATARGTIGWQHAYGDTTPTTTQAFNGSAAFTIAGAPIASDSAIVEAGLDFAVTQAATLGITYNGQIARAARNHAFRADLDIKF